jgi:hypothetical protein
MATASMKRAGNDSGIAAQAMAMGFGRREVATWCTECKGLRKSILVLPGPLNRARLEHRIEDLASKC